MSGTLKATEPASVVEIVRTWIERKDDEESGFALRLTSQ